MCAAGGGGVTGEADSFIFYFSLSQNDRKNTERFYFYREWYLVTLLKPRGKEKIKCFRNLASLILTTASFVLFSYMLFRFFSWSIVHFPSVYTDFSGNSESLSV